jgi:hypothetical protein
MLTYKVDLDYESYLFDTNYQEDSLASKKIISEFEYVFFLVNQESCQLKNYVDYSDEYLNSLRALGFNLPVLNPHSTEYKYWWSHRHNLKIERTCNSKITSAHIALEENLGFYKGAVVEKIEDVRSHIEKFSEVHKWIVKSADSFSGIGHFQFNVENFNGDKIQTALKNKMLLEPLYERVFDIGATYVIENGKINDFFMVENYNSSAGRFRGGAGSSSVDKFKKYIFEKYQFDLSEYEKQTAIIAKKYLDLGALFNIQIDSFVYFENEKLKLYPLVEVNYRKTMGLVINSIAKKYPEARIVEWLLYTNKELKNINVDSSYVRVSPERNHFQTFIHPIY